MAKSVSGTLQFNNRKSGVLLHPTSFPSPYGIGDLGKAAYDFIDFLYDAGFKLWQVLPLGPTGYGDSPYQSFSSFAGQPLIISPDRLFSMGLLKEEDLVNQPEWNPDRIDFGPAIQNKFALLRTAYANFLTSKDEDLHLAFQAYCEKEKDWLFDYSLFMAVKDAHKGVIWTSWEKEIAFPTEEVKKQWANKLTHEFGFYQFIQFVFSIQWSSLKAYANKKNITIVGDIPIFVAFDSADVWANKELFELDAKGFPTLVAGVPPDYFSETGQLWGNPLYHWKAHQKTGYGWWIKRISYTLKLVDYLRIDHFRGFEACWAIPYGSLNAVNGKWMKGPFKDLFYALEEALGKHLPIIAEDLGVITAEVEDLRDSFHFPGMKILQFAFEDAEDNCFLPHHYIANCVCYSGTHDNDTSLGWYQSASEESKDRVRRYMNTDGRTISWDFIRTCLGSVAFMAIVPLQDILSLDSSMRMNIPGTAQYNWQYRYRKDQLTHEIAKSLAAMNDLYGR